jgi:hypothetical protein
MHDWRRAVAHHLAHACKRLAVGHGCVVVRVKATRARDLPSSTAMFARLLFPKVHRLSRLLFGVDVNVSVNVRCRGRRDAEVPHGPVPISCVALRTPSESAIASSTLQSTAPCRALLQTSGRLLRRRPSSPQLERTASSPLALRCCLLVCSRGSSTRAVCSRANNAPALLLTGFFGLSMPSTTPQLTTRTAHAHAHTDRSFINLPLVGAPASIAFGYALHVLPTSSC